MAGNNKKRRRSVLITREQVLKSLRIKKLRGIKDLTIDFSGSPVTGLFGSNGSGKTTILQAIVCLFRAKNEENTRMSRFFKYTSGNKWMDSNYTATVSYVQLTGRDSKPIIDREVHYSKANRWYPRQSSKPDRDVIYVPLSHCIPDIEKVSSSKVSFVPIEGESVDDIITIAVSYILRAKYEGLKVSKINKLDCFTVIRNGVYCHSFNLGAGEQRGFRLLQILYRVPEYSLIVIDELDLTLHTAALKRLVDIMVKIAKERNLQVVFSSHRQDLMKQPTFNVRYIINTKSKTFCLNSPTEDCYEELSGEVVKHLKIYVEDDLAKAIVEKCLKESSMFKYASIYRYGSITNSVRLALGFACQHGESTDSLDDILFINDGDCLQYVGDDSLSDLINRELCGGGEDLSLSRKLAKQMILHFNPPQDNGSFLSPEETIHKALDSLPEEGCDYPELLKDSKAIIGVLDKHDYVNNLINNGYELIDIVNLFAKTEEWNHYVSSLRDWIRIRKEKHLFAIQ